jgi:hypothetical protein
VARILDSAVPRRLPEARAGFVDVVKQAKSISTGIIAEAGQESVDGDQAQALVAMTVKTSTPGAVDQQPREWRMRIGVQQVADGQGVQRGVRAVTSNTAQDRDTTTPEKPGPGTGDAATDEHHPTQDDDESRPPTPRIRMRPCARGW